MRHLLSHFKKLGARGDTLVEVLISIAIITLVVAVGYTVANRSLSNGTAASQRNQALSLSQGQVEQLVNAVNSADITKFQSIKGDFCINPNNPNQNPPPAASSATCKNFQGNNYAVSISYNTGSGIFTVKTTWSQAAGNKSTPGSEGQVVLYYSSPGLFVGTDYCPNFDGIQDSVPDGYKLQDGKCVQKSCTKNCDTTTPPPADASGDVHCEIHSVHSNGPDHLPTVNGDCQNGHCGSPTDPNTTCNGPNGEKNVDVKCTGCWCTAYATDWNGHSSSTDVQHFWNCLGEPPTGQSQWPDPNNPTQVYGNNCPNAADGSPQYGDYNPPTVNTCRPATDCALLTPPQTGDYPVCSNNIPVTNPNSGNTTTGSCSQADINAGVCDPTTSGTGGGTTGGGSTAGGNPQPPDPVTGTCASGYEWNGSTCVPINTGGGGGGTGCGLNDKSLYPNFALMGLFNWLMPFHFGRWC